MNILAGSNITNYYGQTLIPMDGSSPGPTVNAWTDEGTVNTYCISGCPTAKYNCQYTKSDMDSPECTEIWVGQGDVPTYLCKKTDRQLVAWQ